MPSDSDCELEALSPEEASKAMSVNTSINDNDDSPDKKEATSQSLCAEIDGIERECKGKIGGSVPLKRRLKRIRSDPKPDTVTCESMLALRGRPFKTPVLVFPLKSLNGRKFFNISEHIPWLRRACCESGSMYYTQAFQAAVTELRTVLKKQIEVALSPADAILHKLDLDKEDEREAEASVPAKKKRRGAVERPSHLEVSLDGVKLSVQAVTRPLLVEANPRSVLCVVQFCQRHVKAGVSLQKRQRITDSRGGFALPDDICPPILGKVTWQASLLSWAVHWKDEKGKQGLIQRFSARGGSVPAKGGSVPGESCSEPSSSSGSGLLVALSGSVPDFAERRRAAYIRAVKAWNALDQSKRDRIPVPHE